MRLCFAGVIRKYICVFLLLGCSGIFAACGDAPQATVDSEGTEEYYYSIKIRNIPDPDEALYNSDILAEHENWWGWENSRIYQNGCIYRLLFLLDETKEESESFLGYCLQTFHEDTWSWEQILLSDVEWIEGGYTNISGMAGATQEGVFLKITESTVDGEQMYLGYFDGISGKILMEWPEEIEGGSVYRDQDQNIYFISAAENAIYVYDSNGVRQRRTQLDGYLWNGICNPVTGGMLWCGSNSDGARFWKDLNSPGSYKPVKEVDAYAFKAAYAPDGTLYYADAKAVWIEEEQPRQILVFGDMGYSLEELYNICILENGDIQCYVFLDGTLSLLSLSRETEEIAIEQQEIFLCAWQSSSDIFLNQIITRFNRQNSRYHISLLNEEDSSRTELEMSIGQGPDLMILPPLVAENYVQQGYLQNMEGVIEDPALFLGAALESGRINGITYGIPYSCSLDFAVFSKDIAGERQSWTVEEMMQCIRESNAGILDWYFSQIDAINIVMKYGLCDNGNTAYIDWKKGESHLTEQPFRDLLEFAAEYADTGEYEASDVFPMLQEGYIAGTEIHLWKLGMLDYAANCFSGRASYIGYPNSSGKKGIYVWADCLYVNQASDKMEGITEFVRFMLSEDAQKLCIAENESYSMPIRLSTISYLIEQEQKKAENPLTYADSWMNWQEDGLDEEQLRVLDELLEQAQPASFYVTEVEDFFYEELTPYFDGTRSLTDTLKVLDNRIQLYLDENYQFLTDRWK